jgi:hypothetical protein
MKKIIYIILFSICMVGCSEKDMLFNDIDRVQMNDTTTINYSFVYKVKSVVQDTVYIQINTIGNISQYDRQIILKQIPEYDYTYIRDTQTGQIIDTTTVERPYMAEPNVHYVDFNNEQLNKLYVIKAKQIKASIPIILLRDASLKEHTYRLRIELEKSNDFELGESKARALTIAYSDFLQRFKSWRTDTYSSSAYYTFGKYSVAKHQFMIDVSGEVIDEEWYQQVIAQQATLHYRNLFKAALKEFNNNPDNIASGKAPLRESSDVNSPLVTFP